MKRCKALAGLILALALTSGLGGAPGHGDPLKALLHELEEARPKPSQEAWKALPEFIRYCEENASRPGIPGWFCRLSEFGLAVECLLRAQTVLESTGKRAKLIPCLNNLGLTYFELGDSEKALEFLNQGLEIHGPGPDTSSSLSLKDNLATIYTDQGRFQEALALLQGALAKVRVEEDRKQASNFLLSIGSLLGRMGDPAKASTYLLQGLRAKEEMQEEFGIASALLLLGGNAIQRGMPAQAGSYLERGLETAQRIGAKATEAGIHQELSRLLEARGDARGALGHFRQYAAIQDELHSEKGRSHLNRYQLDVLTQRHEAEVGLLKKDNEIKELEARRQQMLRNGSLVVAQREVVVRERLSALGRLTATVAHELRNPLGVIRSSLYSLERGVANQHFQNLAPALPLADRNITRCDNIIKDLLDFSRQRALAPVPTRLDTWVGGFLDEYPFSPDAQVERALHPIPELQVDWERLTQALANVLENAVQSAQAAGDGIRLRVEARIEEGMALIRVRDNGAGLRPEDLERIFEPLFSTKSFGCGLGLPVVKNVMEEHGGSLPAASAALHGRSPSRRALPWSRG